jgi:hypothetical protein
VEWFPALTERRSQSTIQGYEWLLGDDFYIRYSELAALQRCKTVDCVEGWSAKTGLQYDFVVIRAEQTGGLADAFKVNTDYLEVYSANGEFVFRLERP